MSNAARVIVTGGAGFIGSALVRYLIEETEAEVLNFDSLTYAGNLMTLEDISSHPRYRFIQGDICDADKVAEAYSGFDPDFVFHLAAESHVDRSLLGPRQFIETNVVGTGVLLEAAVEHWERLPEARKESFRFLHVSTDEVFGSLDSKGAFSEETAYDPSSPYSASKAGADHLVRAWGRSFGLPILITNCSNNYGPAQFPEKLIPLMILNALEGKDLPIYGKGDNVRDWLFVGDHASALWTVCTKGKAGDTYLIGGNAEKTNLEVVEQICLIVDKLSPPGETPSRKDLIQFVADRPGHDFRYAINSEKIREELGWSPCESFEAGLFQTVRWYLENKVWINAVRSGEYQNWLEANYAKR